MTKCGKALAEAVEAVRSLDPTVRLAVLKEYGHLSGDDYDDLDPEEAIKRASQRNNDALRRYRADLKAAENLAQAITVAMGTSRSHADDRKRLMSALRLKRSSKPMRRRPALNS